MFSPPRTEHGIGHSFSFPNYLPTVRGHGIRFDFPCILFKHLVCHAACIQTTWFTRQPQGQGMILRSDCNQAISVVVLITKSCDLHVYVVSMPAMT